MRIVDDLSDRMEANSATDTYTVSDTRRGEGTEIGVIPPKKLRELINEHSDACRAFQMRSNSGYVDPSKTRDGLSQGEHAGRIEIDPKEITDSLSAEACSCQVRLDTSDPQLVTVTENSGHKEVEINDSVARFVRPINDEQAE